MTIYNNFKPTYLYIKVHEKTGMRYLGKTTKKNPDSYLGSGTYWKSHIRKHGKEHVHTIWKQLFTDVDELVKTALKLSEDNDIVNSNSWANLVTENGLDGLTVGFSSPRKGKIGKKHSIETKHKISNSLLGNNNSPGRKRGTKLTDESRAKMAKSAREAHKRKLLLT